MKRFATARVYLGLSFLSATFTGILVYFGTRNPEMALIWAGGVFIVTLVGIATLDIAVKDNDDDPNFPKLR